MAQLRERPIAAPPAPPDVTRRAPRRVRSPALPSVALAVVAAVSGAAAGAVVARHHTTTSATAATPATAARLVAADAASIAAAVAPAVVSIRTHPAHIGTLFESSASAGEGTGIVIRSDGTIVTDAALVARTAPIVVRLRDGRSLPATVVGLDAASGIAVLKVAAHGLATARLATTDRLRVGDDVVALGDALALPSGPTVSRGVVAALHRAVAISTAATSSAAATSQNRGPARLTGLLEVTNALGAANAGGPVIDANGEVVGIATTAADGDRPPGFAIDVVRVGPVIRAIEEGRAPADAFGVDAIDVTPALAHEYGLPVESGALVAGVVPGSPAGASGLLPDDIVVGFGRERVATAEDLSRRARDPSAASVRLLVVRGRRALVLTVRPVH